MFIQAAADFHGKESRYRTFFQGLHVHNPDVAVIAGDIEPDGLFFKFLDKVDIPVLIVHGNMDSISIGKEIERYENAIFLHEKMYTIDGTNFVGAGGSNPSLDEIYSLSGKKRIPLKDARIDVFVTHVPPKGVMDRMSLGFHIGSEWVKKIVEDKEPRLVICGHVHENPGYAAHGTTIVVNCSVGRRGKYSLININKEIEVNMVE